MYDRLGEVTRQHRADHLHRRDIDWLIEQAEEVERLKIALHTYQSYDKTVSEMHLELTSANEENGRLLRALDRVGFYCAGSELSEVSDFILRVKSGEEKFL